MNYLWLFVIIAVILFVSQMKEGAATSPGTLTQLATSSPYYWNYYLGGYNMHGPHGYYGSYGYYPYHTFPMYAGAPVTYIPAFKHSNRKFGGWHWPL